MLKIWALYVKGLQTYWPSNFENDSTLGDLKSGPFGPRVAGAGQQTFSWDLLLWQLVTFKSFNLQTLYLQYEKIQTF